MSQPQARPASLELYERYSAQDSGVLAAVAAVNPQLQERLDCGIALAAIADGHSIAAVQCAITRHSPQAQRSGQPEAYAKNVVKQVTSKSAKAANPPVKQPAKANAQSRQQPKRGKAKAKDNGMGY